MSKFLASDDKDGLVPVLAMALRGMELPVDVRAIAWGGDSRIIAKENTEEAESVAQWVKYLPYWLEEQSSIPSTHVKGQLWWHVLKMLEGQRQEGCQGSVVRQPSQ